MQVGDVLQFDWGRDGVWDHTVMVTRKNADGTVSLTYQSNYVLDATYQHVASKGGAVSTGNTNFIHWRVVAYNGK